MEQDQKSRKKYVHFIIHQIVSHTTKEIAAAAAGPIRFDHPHLCMSFAVLPSAIAGSKTEALLQYSASAGVVAVRILVSCHLKLCSFRRHPSISQSQSQSQSRGAVHWCLWLRMLLPNKTPQQR